MEALHTLYRTTFCGTNAPCLVATVHPAALRDSNTTGVALGRATVAARALTIGGKRLLTRCLGGGVFHVNSVLFFRVLCSKLINSSSWSPINS